MEDCDANGPIGHPPPPNQPDPVNQQPDPVNQQPDLVNQQPDLVMQEPDLYYQDPHWAKQLQEAFQAGIERKARRQQWLAERRQEQRDLARKSAQHRRKVRTEQLAARRSSDPVLSTGCRLAARTHAEARKIEPNRTARRPVWPKSNDKAPALAGKPQCNTTSDLPAPHRGPPAPCKVEYKGPIRREPAWAKILAADPRPKFLDWIEISIPHPQKWKFASKECSIEELFKVVADKLAIAEKYQQRMDERKVFERSMDVAMRMFRDATRLTWRGAWTYTPFNILAPLPKARPKKDRRLSRDKVKWDLPTIHAMALGLANDRRLARARQQQQKAKQAEGNMEIDALDGCPIIDGILITPYHVAWADGGWLDVRNISIDVLNNETIPHCVHLFKAMSIDQLMLWRTYLTQLGEHGQGHVDKDKWTALNKAIGIQKQQRQKNIKGGKRGQDFDLWVQELGGWGANNQQKVKNGKVQKLGRGNNRGNNDGRKKQKNNNRGGCGGGYNNNVNNNNAHNNNNHGNQQNQNGNGHHLKRGGHDGAGGNNNNHHNNNYANTGRGGGGGRGRGGHNNAAGGGNPNNHQNNNHANNGRGGGGGGGRGRGRPPGRGGRGGGGRSRGN